MSSTSRQQFGAGSLRRKIDESVAGVVFVASALFYVGGTLAMFLKSAPMVA